MNLREQQGATHPAPGTLSVRELLEHDAMQGACLIAGTGGLSRPIARLNVMTVPDIVRWTKQDEFLLTTGYPLPRDADGLCVLIEQLARRGLAGLGIKLDQYLPEVPARAVAAGDAANFPIVIIPTANALDDVLSQAFGTIVNRQARALGTTQAIHDTFLRIPLSGGGLKMLVEKLSDLLRGAAVVVADTNGNLLAATNDLSRLTDLSLLTGTSMLDTDTVTTGTHRDGPGPTWVAAVISAGQMKHGFVVAAEGAEPFPLVAATAVEQAALVAALEITKDLAVASVERQFASNALHDLVTSTPADIADAVARAATFGWDLDRPVAVLVARHEDGTPADRTPRARELATLRAISFWTSAIRSRDHHAAAAGFSTELVAAVGAADAEAFARSIQAKMTAASLSDYSIGVSRVSSVAADIPHLYQEARTALMVGRRLNGPGAVTRFADLGLYRLISSVGANELRSFLNDTLGPVLDLPSSSRADLLETLSALLDNRLNVAQTARTLHYHYNTMRYRVTKLERLLGPFVDDAESTLRIGVALQILRMYEISRGLGFPHALRSPS